MWNSSSLCVVLPTYREKGSIRQCILDFEGLGIVDEILVVNNNAERGTSDEVRATTAREVHQPLQGYGAAIRQGIAEATSDLICVCEPDGTFRAADLLKLLPYSDECDFVFGSRTVSTFIWTGANMDWFLRWGNWAVAKLVEVIFNTPYLSDVGCTMRVIRRSAFLPMEPLVSGNGSAVGFEMMITAIASGARFVQVPVNYQARVGTSSVTGDRRKAFRLGLVMIRLALVTRARRRQIRTILSKAGEVSY